ncbi:hypothetical protein BU24DRAFT_469110 [Aaosphaeria arxii CBS 175.79]|uniref:Uncharacterized protein n=1 Tax=Aaosphaeria arxii CBS 175.79 TaxID=1450172 RepID=A0A6A5X5Y7_9PLEO|nr:uncharacterized protein BU24DRAFT_469110 [Aaosphaeria arxii CBS 175.79]KAF2008257.1 hypothetical protein BU24DRAFT_469110 [Aaosphaeria arxii CBS 175.79]
MSLQTQTQPSRKKRTPADRLHQAVQNGFTPESSSCNDKPVYKKLAHLTKRPYKDMLELWQHYLQKHPTKDPTQFKTLEHFFEMVARQSRGTLNNGQSKHATTHSLKTQARQLRGALKRAKDQVKIEKEVLDMICNYIDGPLKEKLNLSSARRKATYLTIDNYVSMMEYY